MSHELPTAERRDDGADVDCPAHVLATGRCRLGNKQSNNLYLVDSDGTEYYVGTLFRAGYGKALRDRLNGGLS